jgi:LuxR family maltose regulon positive regulatory protein
METAVPELRRTRQDNLLLAWMRSLPESVVRRSPVLSVLSAWSLLMSGDLGAVEGHLDDAERALTAGAHDDDLAAGRADTEDLRTAPATIAVYRAGDVQQALSTFGEAVRSLHAAGNEVDELDASVVLANIWVAAGRPGRARRLYEQALQSATGNVSRTRGPPPTCTSAAELDRELDDLASAEAHLETARVLGERGSIIHNREPVPVVCSHGAGARRRRRPRRRDAAARRDRDDVPARLLPGHPPDRPR